MGLPEHRAQIAATFSGAMLRKSTVLRRRRALALAACHSTAAG
jgi:hypothetical protein